jgi:carbamoylphosphate synthase small subunit
MLRKKHEAEDIEEERQFKEWMKTYDIKAQRRLEKRARMLELRAQGLLEDVIRERLDEQFADLIDDEDDDQIVELLDEKEIIEDGRQSKQSEEDSKSQLELRE